ncbi:MULTISPECIES: Type 1 glutamine amidotransferase-like domain-containing protein [Cyanophyceae]|uniref:Type 1 glutamine amidotransferase-like domain-containing protein n=1 Tax=Cyanophyceae TaxID=3028117 RepID=UPI00168880A9|nr:MULTISPECIES: Type 1 glutamine amidotransferase-like domain-containing protein [Cyanophyceae]MBD1915306.1 Type 1 glutamine amidotransferase-like domain-containing protein [Phormidium sp. FACHB-77]MBD2032823.1 Type 1 glutamine amidotransferase-like domain-containing protein [Phormidium sp. FACHB-322]MBD2051826.1 Type 1 glutamine amidotransferase-like domain-containing protein [Leptolyngbya sp. FACHB-60]
MKLALLSTQETESSATAVKFLVESLSFKDTSAAFIASQPDAERYFFNKAQDGYKSIGVNLDTYIDFESGFDETLMDRVLSKPIVHLSGGNTYRFLHSLKSRGLGEKMIKFAQSGGVFIGISAGAMLLTPTIESAALCGDVNHVGLGDFSSFGLVNFMFVPHATKQQTELHRAHQLVIQRNYDTYLCNDEEGIVILNNQVHLFGQPTLLRSTSGA